jgi:hypothetical protein
LINTAQKTSDKISGLVGGAIIVLVGYGILMAMWGAALDKAFLGHSDHPSAFIIVCLLFVYPTLMTPLGYWVVRTQDEIIRIIYLGLTGILPGFVILFGWRVFREGLAN